MKLKNYFKKPEYIYCPFCDEKINIIIVNYQKIERCDHVQGMFSINYVSDPDYNCVYLKIATSNFIILIFDKLIMIHSGGNVVAKILFDSLNCDRELKSFDETWAGQMVIFS